MTAKVLFFGTCALITIFLAVSDPVLIALLGNTTAIVISIIVAISNRRKLNEVHKATNGMKDALVAATQKSAFSEGVQHQKEEQAEQDKQK